MKCVNCGKEFQAKENELFCSEKCAKEMNERADKEIKKLVEWSNK